MNLENDSPQQQVSPSKWVDMSQEQAPAAMKSAESPLPNGFPNGGADNKFLYFDVASGEIEGSGEESFEDPNELDWHNGSDENVDEPNPRQADRRREEPFEPPINLDIFWNKNPQLSVEMTRKMVEGSALDPGQKERFSKRMDEFEVRAREQGIDPRAVSRTYEQVNKLLSAGDEGNRRPVLPKEQRQKIAEQVLDNAAHPTSIKQDRRLTCSAAALEVRTYSRTPDKAAKAVADVVTTGAFATADGKTKISFRPEELKSDNANERSDASRIFQVLAMNLNYQASEFVPGLDGTVPAGTVRYEQRVPDGESDTGERLIDTRKPEGQNVIMLDGKPVPPHQIDLRTQSNQITGLNEKFVSIIGEKDAQTLHENEANVRNMTEFTSELKRLKAENGFPVIASVDTLNEPFWSDHSEKQRDKPGFTGGGHIVTIMDFDESKGEVSVDNTWSDSRDHLGNRNTQARIPISQMFDAMIQPPEPRAKPFKKEAPKAVPSEQPLPDNLLNRIDAATAWQRDPQPPGIVAGPVYVNRVVSPTRKP